MSATLLVNLQDAGEQLALLVNAAIQGDVVMIAQYGQPVVRLEPIALPEGKSPDNERTESALALLMGVAGIVRDAHDNGYDDATLLAELERRHE